MSVMLSAGDYIPPQLSKVIQRMSGYNTKRVKLNCADQSTASAGSSIMVQLPKGIVDMGSLQMNCKYVCTGTNYYAHHLASHFRSLNLSANGQTIDDCQNVGDLYVMLFNSCASSAFADTKQIIAGGMGPTKRWKQMTTARTVASDSTFGNALGSLSLSDTDSQAATGLLCRSDRFKDLMAWNANETATAGTVRCVENWFAGISSMGMVQSDIFGGPLQLRITFGGNNVTNGTTTNSFAISEIYFTVDVAEYPVYTGSLYNLLASVDQSGMPQSVVIPLKSYQFHGFTSGATTGQESFTFQNASSCLDRVWVTRKNSAYATITTDLPDYIPYFRYSDSVHTAIGTTTGQTPEQESLGATLTGTTLPLTNCIDTLQLNIGTKQTSSYQKKNSAYGYANALVELGIDAAVNIDNFVDSIAEYKSRKWFSCFNTSFKHADPTNILSGVNTLGSNSQIQLDIVYLGNVTASAIYLIFCEQTKLIKVQANGVFNVEY